MLKQDDSITKRVIRVLQDLNEHTAFGGIYYPLDERIKPRLGKGVCRFCGSCVRHPRAGQFCRNNACTGAVQGFSIGDVWYFRCWLGIDSIVMPIAPRGEIVGVIEVGGFFSPGDTDRAQQTILSRLASLDSFGSLDSVTSTLQAMEELDFKRVKAIADFMVAASISSGLNDESLLNMRRRIFNQQQRLAIKLQELTRRDAPFSQGFNSLSAITGALRAGDRHQAMLALDDFLGHVLLSSNGNLEKAKAGMLIMLSALLRENVERGVQWHTTMSRFEQQMVEVQAFTDVESLCFWIEKIILEQSGTTRLELTSDLKESLSDKILVWMRKKFRESVTIADAAADVGASMSSIIHRLKEETDRTFNQHLTAMRISEAKRLLAYTDFSLGEICNSCGFSDQSYFTKVFKKHINLTPREFRTMLEPGR